MRQICTTLFLLQLYTFLITNLIAYFGCFYFKIIYFLQSLIRYLMTFLYFIRQLIDLGWLKATLCFTLLYILLLPIVNRFVRENLFGWQSLSKLRINSLKLTFLFFKRWFILLFFLQYRKRILFLWFKRSFYVKKFVEFFISFWDSCAFVIFHFRQ